MLAFIRSFRLYLDFFKSFLFSAKIIHQKVDRRPDRSLFGIDIEPAHPAHLRLGSDYRPETVFGNKLPEFERNSLYLFIHCVYFKIDYLLRLIEFSLQI